MTGVNPFVGLRHSGRLKFLRDPGESDQLERLSGWHVIVAASGMCDAGRVRRHLKRLLWRRQATVLLSGYQAVGTLGRILQEGAKRVSIQGEDIQVRARIRSLDVYSGHADAGGLVAWAKARGPVAAGVFLAHGEPSALEALRGRLVPTGLAAERIRIPALDDSYVLTREGVQSESAKGRRLPPDAPARADWHNARAQLLMELNQQLDNAKDDRTRELIIARLAAGLQDGLAAEPGRTPPVEA
jgi:metallo-beta-lactamase family protein